MMYTLGQIIFHWPKAVTWPKQRSMKKYISPTEKYGMGREDIITLNKYYNQI